MTLRQFALASIAHYRRPHLAVVFGVAGAVTVLAGSLLVGASVRDSLRSITTGRLGHTSIAIAAEQPFMEQLAQRVATGAQAPVTPLLSLTGNVRHEASSKRAGGVQIYGVDARFFDFHGVQATAPGPAEVLLSPDLAAELGAAPGDAMVIRVPRVTDVPLDSLHGRRDDAGRSIRLTMKSVLAKDAMGSFSLAPGQAPVRSVYVALSRLQRDLGLTERVNTLLIAPRSGDAGLDAARVRTVLSAAITPADLGLRQDVLIDAGALVVESASGLIADDLAAGISRAASETGRNATTVLTWLANRITVGTHTVPYSLVTAIGNDAAGDARLAALLATKSGETPIVLNEWAAHELDAAAGKTLELEYLRWADEGRLVTEHARFQVAGVIPMSGLALDRRLAPDYPGITAATNLADWDPPFPIDLSLVRKQDEEYWDRYRTAPKAFIPIEAGQRLWGSRYGRLTSIRVAGSKSLLLEGIGGKANGIRVIDVRSQNLSASAGATDFGAYFSYFSFFLMVSALLLAALFFRLSVEQRLSQIGVLRATGFPVATVQRVLMMEGALVTLAGAAVGVFLAIAWARLMVLALTTWWVDAVGTTELSLRVDAWSLVIGAVGAAAAALVSLFLAIRSLSRTSPRAQIAGWLPPASASSGRRAITIAATALLLGAAVSGAAWIGKIPQAGGFFAAGSLTLVGGLAAFRAWLGSGRGSSRLSTMTSLGLKNAAWRPGRSLTAAGLVASAVFLLVAVDSFRKTADDTSGPASSTGGFDLIAESELPIVNDVRTAEGRDALNLSLPAGVRLVPFRLRPGDDTSCLNLYQPRQPRVLGVPQQFVDEHRFRFANVMATAGDAGKANPWTLLGGRDANGRIPAIVDQTSLQYVLHASVGDVLTIDADTSRPIDLQIVASLDDSVLQGEILIGEAAFRDAFPGIAGYRYFLIGTDGGGSEGPADIASALEDALQPFGFDAQTTAAKLDAFHRVENTYLSTFQALGGLGLVLGCLGLVAVVARNVFERRRELALLGAAGFSGRDLQRVVAIEHVAIVGAGLAIGLVAAIVAIAPVLMSRSGAAPWRALAWLIPVAIAGFGAAYGATRSLRRMPLLSSLRSE
jgi:ABC-type antimicrobial peptide transport system permease subunit